VAKKIKTKRSNLNRIALQFFNLYYSNRRAIYTGIKSIAAKLKGKLLDFDSTKS
jgi:hypothetical protein